MTPDSKVAIDQVLRHAEPLYIDISSIKSMGVDIRHIESASRYLQLSIQALKDALIER